MLFLLKNFHFFHDTSCRNSWRIPRRIWFHNEGRHVRVVTRRRIRLYEMNGLSNGQKLFRLVGVCLLVEYVLCVQQGMSKREKASLWNARNDELQGRLLSACLGDSPKDMRVNLEETKRSEQYSHSWHSALIHSFATLKDSDCDSSMNNDERRNYPFLPLPVPRAWSEPLPSRQACPRAHPPRHASYGCFFRGGTTPW